MIAEQTDHGEKIISEGVATPRLQSYFDAVTDLVSVKIFVLASLPDATKNEGRQIYVSDATAGATMAYSDGTNWRINQTTVLT